MFKVLSAVFKRATVTKLNRYAESSQSNTNLKLFNMKNAVTYSHSQIYGFLVLFFKSFTLRERARARVRARERERMDPKQPPHSAQSPMQGWKSQTVTS